jgi:hypothetical protein
LRESFIQIYRKRKAVVDLDYYGYWTDYIYNGLFGMRAKTNERSMGVSWWVIQALLAIMYSEAKAYKLFVIAKTHGS